MSKSKSIKYIDWAKDTIDNSNSGWILPQTVCAIGNYWPIVKGDDGLFSFTLTLRGWKELISRGELDLEGTPITLDGATRLLAWLNAAPRGELLGTMRQTKGEGVRWSAPVPIILSAFKQYRGVGYSAWNWTDPGRRFLLDHDILEWSNHFGVDVEWTNEELVEFRTTALAVKSGVKQGTVRTPESCATVFGVTDPQFKALPRLMKLSLTQLWCFHPRVRTDLMITDHVHLDSMPPPLVSGEVFQEPTATELPISQSPWDV